MARERWGVGEHIGPELRNVCEHSPKRVSPTFVQTTQGRTISKFMQ